MEGGVHPLWNVTETTFQSSETEKFKPETPEIILLTLAKPIHLILESEVRNKKFEKGVTGGVI